MIHINLNQEVTAEQIGHIYRYINSIESYEHVHITISGVNAKGYIRLESHYPSDENNKDTTFTYTIAPNGVWQSRSSQDE